jgi:phytoene synthase
MEGARERPEACRAGACDIEAARRYCREISRRRGRNFYYAFPLMPREKKDALCAVYAFMRHSDDIADDTGEAGEGVGGGAGKAAEALARWRGELHEALQGRFGPSPVWPALAESVARFSIPGEYFDELLDGIEMDLAVRRYEKFEDLYRYCYRVASVVGLVCLHIFGFRDREALKFGEACGIAFQLTNILRDIREDGSLGRVYLPLEDLRRFGVTEENLLEGSPPEAVAELIRFEAMRAREYYAAAMPLFPLIDRDSRAGLRTMMEIYGGILSRILKDPLCVYRGRVRLSGARKVAIALRACLFPRPPAIPG